MATVKILTANIYVGNDTPGKAANKIKDLQPHGVALQEASGALGTLENTLGGYRFAYNHTKQGKNTPVLVKENMDDGTSGWGTVLGCDPVGDTKCGKQRWISYSVSAFPGGSKRRVMLGSHFNCSVQNDDGTADSGEMLDRYKTQSGRLGDLIGYFQGIGWPVFVGADFNYRLKGKIDTPGEAPDWSPYGIARKYKLKYHAHGIDGIMWDPDHYSFDHATVIGQSQTGSDHDWLLVVLNSK